MEQPYDPERQDPWEEDVKEFYKPVKSKKLKPAKCTCGKEPKFLSHWTGVHRIKCACGRETVSFSTKREAMAEWRKK